MKAIITLTTLLLLVMGFSGSASAEQDCYGALLGNYTKDSNSFQIYNEEVSEGFENKEALASAKAIGLLEQKLDCSKGSLKIASISCREIVPGNSFSKVCYVESENGYFFVSIDMMEKINIIFSRWD
jgi:hypothetical protein